MKESQLRIKAGSSRAPPESIPIDNRPRHPQIPDNSRSTAILEVVSIVDWATSVSYPGIMLFAPTMTPLRLEESAGAWNFEAEEESLKTRPDNAFYRALRKSIADQRAECQREAEALGFPSWEAKERHDRAKS